MQQPTQIRIGTSGWAYPHWNGRFYPPELPAQNQLAYYAQHFDTVEINASFYRLPSQAQFAAWARQTAAAEAMPDFCFAVKASRYVTHLKKLQAAEEGLARLLHAANGLGKQRGPLLFQLPPHWKVNAARLATFLTVLRELAPMSQAAFEFRDPSWVSPEVLRLLDDAGYALVVAVGGPTPTPTSLDVPLPGRFRYLRFHHGASGIGLSDDELAFWADRIVRDAAAGVDVYAYFNNDAEGYAIRDALQLRALIQRR